MKLITSGINEYLLKTLKKLQGEVLFDDFKNKYKIKDVLHYVRSVIFFDDVPNESWEALKPIKEKVTSSEIKEKLSREVIGYEKRLLEGNK